MAINVQEVNDVIRRGLLARTVNVHTLPANRLSWSAPGASSDPQGWIINMSWDVLRDGDVAGPSERGYNPVGGPFSNDLRDNEMVVFGSIEEAKKLLPQLNDPPVFRAIPTGLRDELEGIAKRLADLSVAGVGRPALDITLTEAGVMIRRVASEL